MSFGKKFTHLRIMVLNAQDLFLFFDNPPTKNIIEYDSAQWQRLSQSLYPNKSQEKCQILAESILHENIDLLFMTEVGGIESMNNFNQYFLNNLYHCYTLASLSERGIDMGFFVKKTLPLKVDLKIHTSLLNQPSHITPSRGFLEASFSFNDSLMFIFIGVHLKSKLNLSNKDYEGRTLRGREVESLINIYQNHQITQDIPIFIGGDFNGCIDAESDPELWKFYQETDLRDVFELAQVPLNERTTFYYFNQKRTLYQQQLDYLLISKKYQSWICPEKTYVAKYRKNFQIIAAPQSVEHKAWQPSDHQPVVTEFVWQV